MVRELISKVILTRTDHPRGLLTRGNRQPACSVAVAGCGPHLLIMRRGYTRGECTHVKRVRMVAPRDRDPAHSVSNSGLDHLRGLSNNLFDRRLREAVRLRQVLGSLQRWRGTPDQRRNARRCGDGLHDWVRSRDSQSSHHKKTDGTPGGGI